MSYGFQFINTSGFVVVDDQFVRLRLISSGTLAASNSTIGWRSIPIPSGTTGPILVFVQPHSLNSYIGHSNTFAAPGNVSCLSTSAFNYKIYSADATPLIFESTHGLEVFNSSGALTFSSKYRYPRVVGVYQGSVGVANTSFPYPKTFTIDGNDSGSIPWVMLNNLVSSPFGVGSEEGMYYGVCARFTSNTVCEIRLFDVTMYIDIFSDPWNNTTSERTAFDPYRSDRISSNPQFVFAV